MGRYLDIIEVSQKQAYIFASNSLRNNIECSENIVRVTSSEYFSEVCGDAYSEEDNFVFSGGGHTVLSFSERDDAKNFNSILTRKVMEDFPGMELFVCVMKYEESKNVGENIKELTKSLEKKKSIRRNSFRQETFGIERENGDENVEITENSKSSGRSIAVRVPGGYMPVYKFEDLGGDKGDSSFVAIVHIDGNGMGARVNALYEQLNNETNSIDEYLKKVKMFSDCIDEDFKTAYKEMTEEVANAIELGKLDDLRLKDKNGKRFPVRDIIMSGDDVCFVSEGRIGIECARIFIEKLRTKVNAVDKKGYEACGGIAIVHSKYPFFRAYELAESLCSNAKRFGAALEQCFGNTTEGKMNGADISSIDWHISFGELKDSVGQIRRDYQTADGKHLELRPYIIGGNEEKAKNEKIRRYENIRKLLLVLNDKKERKQAYARGTIKQIRPILTQGELEVQKYLKFHKIDIICRESYYGIFEPFDLDMIGKGVSQEGKVFIKTADGEDRSILFDAIEIMDEWLPIGED